MNTDRTYGVEIEAHLPNNTTRGQLAERLRAAGIRAYCEHYNHATRDHWKLTTDSSLGYLSRESVEVVSPVLRGEAGLAATKTVLDVMRAFGCTVSVKCGLHVHVYAKDLSLEQLRALAINFVHCESGLDAIVPPSRRRDANSFVLSNRTAFGGSYDNEAINRAIDAYAGARTIEDLLTVVAAAGSDQPNTATIGLARRCVTRYRKLNALAYGRYGTVEFRQHSGTVEAEKALNWIRLCMAFVERSKASKPRKRPSTKPHNPAGELGMMLRFLQLDKDACDYFRKRRRELAKADSERAAAARRAA